MSATSSDTIAFDRFQKAAEGFLPEAQDRLRALESSIRPDERDAPDIQFLRDRRAALRLCLQEWLQADSGAAPEAYPAGRLQHVLLGRRRIREALHKKQEDPGAPSVDGDDLMLGIANLLSAPKGAEIDVVHISDCADPRDTTLARLRDKYKVLGQLLDAEFRDEYLVSRPGRSFHTGFQALQLIGERAFHAADHGVPERPLHILINNADRSKHKAERQAQGSPCLWAKVLNPKTGTIHHVVGADHEAFVPLKPWIISIAKIQGIPGHPRFGDLSNGTQFRSNHNFPYPQALIALSHGGAPAGFQVEALDLSEIPDPDLKPNEAFVGDTDTFGNVKLFTSHPDGVHGLARCLSASVDNGTEIAARFFDPDTGKIIFESAFILKEFLGGDFKGRPCIWNGSSRTPGLTPIVEIGINKSGPDDVISELLNLPPGTRVVFCSA